MINLDDIFGEDPSDDCKSRPEVPDLASNPQPCPVCGSGVLWQSPDGQIICECSALVPEDASRVVLAQLPTGNKWDPHPLDRDNEVDVIDDEVEFIPIDCPSCGEIEA